MAMSSSIPAISMLRMNTTFGGGSLSRQSRETVGFILTMLETICDGDETLNDYVLSWMAHLVQKPAELQVSL